MAYEPANLFEAIYAGNDPRLANLDAATFRSLYDQYNGALQLWGLDAANAVLQQQLQGLPAAGGPLPAAGGPRSGRRDFTQANTGAGTGAPVTAGAGSTGGPGGRGGAIPSDYPTNVGAGSTGGPGGRGGATGLADIAAAAAGSAASQIAPNVGAGATGGPSTRGGAIPQPVNVGAGATGGPSTRGGAIPQPVNVGAGATGGPSTRGGAIPQPVNVGAGATGGPSTRGGAIPQPVNVGAGATGGPSTRGGAIPQPVNVGAGATGGPSTRGGAIPSDFPSTANAGSRGGPGGRGGAIPSDFPSTANAGSAGGPGGRGGALPTPGDIAVAAAGNLTAFDEGGQYPAPTTALGLFDGSYPGAATDLTTLDEGGQYPAGPTTPYQGDWADQQFDTAVHDWLGTEGAANLLEPGAGAPSAPGGSFWADGSPVSPEDQWMYDRWGPGPYTDDQIHEWLGTPEAANLLGLGGSNFSDAPLGGGVEVPEKVVDEGFGVDSDFRGGGIDLGLGGGDLGLGGGIDLGLGGGNQTNEMPGAWSAWDSSKGLADIERQRGKIDERRVMTFGDQQRQQELMQRGLPGAFNARGMLNSGQYDRAEGMQAAAFDRARGRTEMGFQEAENALSEAELQANTGASFGAFQASFEEADRRAKAASNIGGAWF